MIQNIVKIFANPLLYIWIVLLVSLYRYYKPSSILLILNIMFYCLCNNYVGSTLSSLWKVNDSFKENVIYDAAVILASVIGPGDIKSIVDTDYNFRLYSSSSRLSAGIAFVKSGHAKSLLFGNYSAGGYDEGPIIRKYAEYQGLKEDEIRIYGGDVRRTLDEAKGVKKFLDENEYKNVILVTSEMHMRRALALFNRVGIFPDSYSVEKIPFKSGWKYFIPSAKSARLVQGFFCELFGYVGYYFKGDI